MTKFKTNSRYAIWWRNLRPIEVVPLKSILNYSSLKIYSRYGVNTLGPLCLWQCFEIFLYFWTSDLQYFLESDFYFVQICIFRFVSNLFKIWPLCDVSCHIALECMPFWQAHGTFTLQFQIWSWDVITYIFGHQMTPLARVAKLATWWHHSH